MTRDRRIHGWREIVHRLLVAAGAIGMTLVFFMVLPMMQAISKPPATDTLIRSVDTGVIDPPPPPPQDEPEQEEEKPQDLPELADEAPPLSLDQLELSLSIGTGASLGAGDFTVTRLTSVTAGSDDVDALFNISDLDQQPRIVYQPGPMITEALRKKMPGTVYIIFIVNAKGRVENPMVQSSTEPVFEKPALSAVKQWKFEPGKRNGQPVRFRMRVPIAFQ